MKKNLFKTGIAACSLMMAVQTQAQLADGSIAPNFVINDINGNSQNLYSILGQGKTVILDISATWCGPCWNFHQAHVLKTVWENHGPTGGNGVLSTTTNDMYVIFVEGDHSTGMNELNGIGANTQGNWVTGTPYPIVDDNNSVNITSNYAIGYYPTIYMICPDKVVREIGQSPAGGSSYYTDAQIYALKNQNCIAATAATDASLHNTSTSQVLASCDSVTPTIMLGNYGTNALTSCVLTYKVDGVVQRTTNWTGNLATYGVATVSNVNVGASTAGSHVLTVTVSNPNGTTDASATNDVATLNFTKYSATGGPLVVETFASFPPSGWSILNGGATATWQAATAGNAAPSTTLKFYDIPAAEVDAMVIPGQNFTGMNNPVLKFDRAKKMYSTVYVDKLNVLVSGDCGATWTTVWSKTDGTPTNPLNTVTAAATSAYNTPLAADWKTDSISLSAFAGNPNVMVKFEGVSGYGNNLFLDNINFSNSVGVKEVSPLAFVEAYPNPASSQINLNIGLLKNEVLGVNVFNHLGQLVLQRPATSFGAGDNLIQLDASSLANGIYTISIHGQHSMIVKKVVVSK